MRNNIWSRHMLFHGYSLTNLFTCAWVKIVEGRKIAANEKKNTHTVHYIGGLLKLSAFSWCIRRWKWMDKATISTWQQKIRQTFYLQILLFIVEFLFRIFDYVYAKIFDCYWKNREKTEGVRRRCHSCFYGNTFLVFSDSNPHF